MRQMSIRLVALPGRRVIEVARQRAFDLDLEPMHGLPAVVDCVKGADETGDSGQRERRNEKEIQAASRNP